jgi:hypothetical protein
MLPPPVLEEAQRWQEHPNLISCCFTVAPATLVTEWGEVGVNKNPLFEFSHVSGCLKLREIVCKIEADQLLFR